MIVLIILCLYFGLCSILINNRLFFLCLKDFRSSHDADVVLILVISHFNSCAVCLVNQHAERFFIEQCKNTFCLNIILRAQCRKCPIAPFKSSVLACCFFPCRIVTRVGFRYKFLVEDFLQTILFCVDRSGERFSSRSVLSLYTAFGCFPQISLFYSVYCQFTQTCGSEDFVVRAIRNFYNADLIIFVDCHVSVR